MSPAEPCFTIFFVDRLRWERRRTLRRTLRRPLLRGRITPLLTLGILLETGSEALGSAMRVESGGTLVLGGAERSAEVLEKKRPPPPRPWPKTQKGRNADAANSNPAAEAAMRCLSIMISS